MSAPRYFLREMPSGVHTSVFCRIMRMRVTVENAEYVPVQTFYQKVPSGNNLSHRLPVHCGAIG